MSILSTSASSLFSTGSSSSGGSTQGSWLGDAENSILQSQNSSNGLIGMLQGAADGTGTSITDASNMFASISSDSNTASVNFYVQLAAQRQQQEQADQIQKLQDQMQQQASMVQPTNVLPSTIYLDNGTSLDTTTNILTMQDGTQYDVTTGALYVDPSQVQQLPGGGWIDMKNNIMHTPSGMQIDTVTGLTIAQENALPPPTTSTDSSSTNTGS